MATSGGTSWNMRRATARMSRRCSTAARSAVCGGCGLLVRMLACGSVRSVTSSGAVGPEPGRCDRINDVALVRTFQP